MAGRTNTNFRTSGKTIGQRIIVTHGPMTEATATLDGQIINWICPPGRRFAVRKAGFWVGTRATTGTVLLHIAVVPMGTAVASGVNLSGTADNAGGAAVDDNGSLAADNSYANITIDDEEGSGGVNVISPGNSFAIETSGTLTGLANVWAVLELEEIEPLAGV